MNVLKKTECLASDHELILGDHGHANSLLVLLMLKYEPLFYIIVPQCCGG